MQRIRGFTLIEIMIVVVVIAALAAIGFPSYRDHIARGQRSQGQQFLIDVAQREEQFLLDRRQYTDVLGNGGLNMTQPAMKYDAPTITLVAGPPPGFVVCMNPTNGSNLAARSDGTICINSQGERWRQPSGGNTIYENGECLWEDRGCRIVGEK